MAAKVKPIPDGYHTLTPYLVVDGAERIIQFMKQAFGAQFMIRADDAAGRKIMHAKLKIGNSGDDRRCFRARKGHVGHAVRLRAQCGCGLPEGAQGRGTSVMEPRINSMATAAAA